MGNFVGIKGGIVLILGFDGRKSRKLDSLLVVINGFVLKQGIGAW